MSIGGFFELEIKQLEEYHSNAIRLNTGRNALEYILRCRGYVKIFIPTYTCDVILEPIIKLNIDYEFYNIDRELEPIFEFNDMGKNEGFLYTNYFGLKSSFIEESLVHSSQNLIIDNAQSFYSQPIKGIDVFYSARKFFGVPDGAYVYITSKLNDEIEMDFSYDRCLHLLMRADNNISGGYSEFKKNESGIGSFPIRKMSNLTHELLKSIDYKQVAKKRIENFQYIHNNLLLKNQLDIDDNFNDIPMIYPYLTDKNDIRDLLLKNNIFCPHFWPNVLEWAGINSWEYQLASNVVFLPIDQRYGKYEMDHILKIINS